MTESFLILQSAGHLYAIPAYDVQEIVHLPATVQLPGQPPVLQGFLNLRGRAVPVVSIAALFHEDGGQPGLYAPLIVVGAGNSAVALLADAVNEVAEVSAAAIEPLGEHDSFNGCAIGRFSSDAGPVVVLSVDRVLLQKEKQCISALQQQVAKRLEQTGACG